MFTKPQLLAKKDLIEYLPELPLQVIKYGQDDFKEPEGEEAIVICTLDRNKTKDEVAFFISSLKATGISEDYLRDYLADTDFLFKEIDVTECDAIIEEQTAGLKVKFTFPWKGEYLRGLLLVNDWNYICLVAETNQEYISFFWEAGA